MSGDAAYDVVVVGGGVNGLATAWNLARLGAGRVALLEQFGIGHDRGSSHGASRITRTSYRDPRYARLVREAQAEDWPRLERDAGASLVNAAPGVFFGPTGGQIAEYARAATESGAPVEAVSAEDARRRFPQFRFAGAVDVLVDRSAGVVAAEDTVAALARLVRAAGVDVRETCRVDAIEPRADAVAVVTERGTLRAARVVVTAGAWASRLVPALAARLTVARQTVAYFELDLPPEDVRAPRFPVWVWLGTERHDHFYGLPEFGRPGVKAARHATGTGRDDPDDPPSPPSAEDLGDVRAFFARELTRPPGRLLGWERCLYTNEAREDFVLGPLPGEPRIVVGAACSGHAFKFAPLTGRVLAETALRGRTSSPAFEAMRSELAP
jgi:sarcosine oxidase